MHTHKKEITKRLNHH